jgi:hypothetical protein
MTIQNHLVQQTQLDKQDTNLPASSSSSISMNEQINYTNELNSVKSRLELVESKIDILIRQNESLLLAQQTNSRLNSTSTNSNNVAQLTNNDLENLKSRITILETELLLKKQVINLQKN